MGTRHLERDGGRIGYDDTGGTGPLVLCAPGMGDLRGVYRFLTPRLAAAGYRVVTADVRGHGESSAVWADYSPEAFGADIVALLRRLAGDATASDAGGPAVLVGESFAAASAVWAAAEAPDLVAGLALTGPFVRDAEMGAVARLGAKLVTRWPVLWDMYYRSLYPTTPPPDFAAYRKALRANLAEPGRMAALRGLLAASKAACEARLGEVRCPVLVLMGSRDPDFPDPVAEARWITERVADGTLVMVDGAGHYPPAEMPDQTAAALLPFLARALDGRRAA